MTIPSSKDANRLAAIWANVSSHRLFGWLLAGLGSFANGFGLFLYLPLLFGVVMSFDAPGSGQHWAHWVFVIANVMLGPLCLTGLISHARRYWGLFGFALAVLGWVVLDLICGGRFACR